MRAACDGCNGTQLFEHLALDFEDLFFGFEDLDFQFLQFGRGEALGVHQSLFALVIGRRQMHIRLGDFQIIAEDVVEADLERADAGAGPLALLDLGEVGFAVARNIAQLIEAGVETVANGTAVVQIDGRLIGEGGENAIANFGNFVEALHPDRAGVADLESARRCFSGERPQANAPARPRRADRREERAIFDSRRSRSRIDERSLASSARRIALACSSSTASRRASISAGSIDGASSRRRSRRPPMPVRVRSRTWSSVESFDSPANSGSTNSRLRTVVASRINASARS